MNSKQLIVLSKLLMMENFKSYQSSLDSTSTDSSIRIVTLLNDCVEMIISHGINVRSIILNLDGIPLSGKKYFNYYMEQWNIHVKD